MTPQTLRRRSLAPPAARQDLACLPSTKISPHNSATETAVSVTRVRIGDAERCRLSEAMRTTFAQCEFFACCRVARRNFTSGRSQNRA